MQHSAPLRLEHGLHTSLRDHGSSPCIYRGALGVVEAPLVSSDIIQDPRASVIDLEMTQVVDGNLLKVISWYENEWGYSAQLVRFAKAEMREPSGTRA